MSRNANKKTLLAEVKKYIGRRSQWYRGVYDRSVLPDGGINFGSEEYVKEKARKFNAVICPYGTPAGDGVRCGVDCTLCLREQYVLFYKH